MFATIGLIGCQAQLAPGQAVLHLSDPKNSSLVFCFAIWSNQDVEYPMKSAACSRKGLHQGGHAFSDAELKRAGYHCLPIMNRPPQFFGSIINDDLWLYILKSSNSGSGAI